MDFSRPQGWTTWKARFERYRTLSKLDKEAAECQVSTLLYSMGAEAEAIFAALPLSDDDRKDWTKVIEAFDTYFQPTIKRNS